MGSNRAAADSPRPISTQPDSSSHSTPSTSSSSSFSKSRLSRGGTRNRESPGGDDGEVDGIECSRGCCKSCVAGAIADGVAVCCCPCAVLDLVAFVLVRVPWMMGRRCLKLARGRRRKRITEGGRETRRTSSGMSRNYVERWRVNEGIIKMTTSFGNEEDDEEADERVWMELCRGFGRLSFTGIQSAGKGS